MESEVAKIVKYLYLYCYGIPKETIQLDIQLINKPNEFGNVHIQICHKILNCFKFLTDKDFYFLVYELIKSKSLFIELQKEEIKDININISITPEQNLHIDMLNAVIEWNSILSEEGKTILSKWCSITL